MEEFVGLGSACSFQCQVSSNASICAAFVTPCYSCGPRFKSSHEQRRRPWAPGPMSSDLAGDTPAATMLAARTAALQLCLTKTSLRPRATRLPEPKN